MSSTPDETTTKTEPWDGAKPYLKDIYAQYDQLIKNGDPAQWSGNTVADQSSATIKGQQGIQNYASNAANAAGLNAATNATNNITSGKFDQTGNKALAGLTSGINLGTNPATAGISNYLTQAQSTAPGTSTLNAAANYTNPGVSQTQQIASGLSNNWTNPGVAATQNAAKNIATSYTNPGVAATQSAMAGINTNYSNPALAQASTLGNYTNAANGLQTAQANSLASANNPALANLQATASGANIGKNTALDQVVSNQQDQIAQKLATVTNPQIAGGAAGAGRLGSNAFASQLNNAQTAAANEMSKVATEMYANQYNTDVNNMLNANTQYGNFYNSDVANQLNANAALSATSNSQQGQIVSGVNTYGNMADANQTQKLNASNLALQGANQLGSQSIAQQGMNNDLVNMQLSAANQLGSQAATQQGIRNDQTNLQLGAANQVGNQSIAQQGVRTDAANSLNSQYNSGLSNQLAGLGLQNSAYQSGVSNALTNAGLQQSAANSLNANQNAQAGLQLSGAQQAAANYTNGLLPYQTLTELGATQDTRSQDILNNLIQRYEQGQQQDLTNLANFTNILNGGGYSNTTMPVYNNTGTQVLGGLTALFSLL